jgi:hypothetical protein
MIAFPCAALASVLLTGLGRQSPLTEIVRQMATASIGAILVFLSAFIAVAVAIAPAHVAGEDVNILARTIGYSATTVDWAVTAIVLGLAHVGAVLAGRGTWAPRWLQGLAGFAMVVTVVELVGLATDTRAMAFPSVPIGLVLLACAGLCALRPSRPSGQGVMGDQPGPTTRLVPRPASPTRDCMIPFLSGVTPDEEESADDEGQGAVREQDAEAGPGG